MLLEFLQHMPTKTGILISEEHISSLLFFPGMSMYFPQIYIFLVPTLLIKW